MKAKTSEQIEKQVGLLKRLKAAMPERSGFGDNNHADLERKVVVLNNAIGKTRIELEERLDRAYDQNDTPAQDALLWAMGDLAEDLTDEDEVKMWEKHRGVRA